MACGDDGTDKSDDPATGADAGDNARLDGGKDGSKKDAGKPTPSPVRDAAVGTPRDASTPRDAAVVTLDAGPSGSKDAAVGDHCAKLACTNLLDCVIGHPDALDCGFTACTGMVCTK
ncbi:MAG: hypothetical protein JWN48_3378 [Myxococcaceae bacterium]|nr:hypothetical protein [Myxococcaceae bacterium]